MTQYDLLLWVAVAAVLAILPTVFLLRRRHEKAMRRLADRLGMKYLGKAFEPESHSVRRFDLFRRGSRSEVTNAMTNRIGDVDVILFEYRYYTHGRRAKEAAGQTVVILHCRKHRLPRFMLRPIHLGHQLARMFGDNDIGFDCDPAFARRYHVSGQNREEILDAFHMGARQFLRDLDKPAYVEGIGSWLLYYRRNRCLSPPKAKALLNEAIELSSHLSVR